MSQIQYISFVPEIPNIGQYDFVVSVLTSWQFDVAVAYIQSHHYVNGILIVEPVPFSNPVKYRLSKEQVLPYESLFEKIYFCRSRKQPYKIKNLARSLFSKKTERPIIWMRPLPNISLRLLSNIVVSNREIHYVALDEGVSSYTPPLDSYKIMYSHTAIAYKQWFVQKILNMFGTLFIKEQEDFGLFYSQHNSLVPNQEACSALQCLYFERTRLNTKHRKCILFFKDYSIIPDEQAIRIIEEILAGMKSDSYDIIIKKHPRDIQSPFDSIVSTKYPNVHIINSMISGEELVAEYNPFIIVGGFSTVLISSCVIYNIPVISFAGIYTKNRLVSPMHERQINFFMDRLSDYITFCQSTNDVCEKLNENILKSKQ